MAKKSDPIPEAPVEIVPEKTIPEPIPEIPQIPQMKAEEISAEELAEPLAANMPEPTDAKVGGPEPSPSSPTQFTQNNSGAQGGPEIRDSEGNVFNSNFHRTDNSGNPKKGARGQFLKKYKSGNAGDPSKPLAADFVNTSGAPDQFDGAAEMMMRTGLGIAAAFFSDDVRPDNAEEHNMVKVPLAAVLREKGVVDLTPTQMLCFALIAYAGTKAAKPTVRERAILLYLKLKGFFTGKRPEIPTK